MNRIAMAEMKYTTLSVFLGCLIFTISGCNYFLPASTKLARKRAEEKAEERRQRKLDFQELSDAERKTFRSAKTIQLVVRLKRGNTTAGTELHSYFLKQTILILDDCGVNVVAKDVENYDASIIINGHWYFVTGDYRDRVKRINTGISLYGDIKFVDKDGHGYEKDFDHSPEHPLIFKEPFDYKEDSYTKRLFEVAYKKGYRKSLLKIIHEIYGTKNIRDKH